MGSPKAAAGGRPGPRAWTPQLQSPVFPGAALEAPPLTVLPVAISQDCAFPAPGDYVTALSPARFPLWEAPLGSVGSPLFVRAPFQLLLAAWPA